MNDLKNTQTADLIAEWKRTHTYDFPSDWEDSKMVPIEKLNGRVVMTNLGDIRAKDAPYAKIKATIATELDRRCMDAGIAMIEGQFHYARKWFSVVLEDGEHLLREVLCAEYSHQYRTWLLLKEGGGNA